MDAMTTFESGPSQTAPWVHWATKSRAGLIREDAADVRRLDRDAVLAALDLPPNPTLVDLITRVAQMQQKQLCFEGFEGADTEMLTSFWFDKPDKGLILYRYIDPPWYRVHGVCHELAHILLGHLGCEFADQGGMNVMSGLPTATRRVDTLKSNALEATAEELAYALGRMLRKGSYLSRVPETVFG